MPSTSEWAISIALPLIVTCVACSLSPGMESAWSYFELWLIYMFLDTCWGNLFYMILLIPSRKIARRLPGAVVPNDEKALLIQEEQCNDPTIYGHHLKQLQTYQKIGLLIKNQKKTSRRLQKLLR